MIKQMVKEHMYIRMVHNIMGIGQMINNMDLVQKYGQMVLGMRDNIYMEKNMEKENLIGLITHRMLENSQRIIYMERDFINGLMVESIKVNGKIIK